MHTICMILTNTPWNDQRHYFKQVPALISAGHRLIFFAGIPHEINDIISEHDIISKKQIKYARRTGGINLIKRILFYKPNVVQLCSIEQLPLGILLKIVTKVKVVYDCREDMYHSFRDSKIWMPKYQRIILSRFAQFIEWIASKLFDGFVVSDPALYNIHSSINNQKNIIFYNTPLLSQFTNNLPALSQREYDLVLLGGMFERSGFMILTEALEILYKQGKKLKVLLIGMPDKKSKEALNSLISAFNIENNIYLTGVIPYTDVPNILPKARIGLVLLKDMPKYHNNIACKVFEYMACAMPCICSDLPPQRQIIKEGVNGLFFKPENVNQLVKAIETLLDNEQLSIRMGINNRKEVESYWHAERDQKIYIEFYNKLLNA